jgi:cytochrome c551/c552
VYGSPQTNVEDIAIKGVKVSDDGMKVRLVTEKHNRYNVHEVTLHGVKSKEKSHLVLHPTFFYTMNNIPEGEKLPLSELSTKRTKKVVKPTKQTVSKKTAVKKTPVLTDAQVQPLLTNNTCVACHAKDKRMVGPSFVAIAKRGYSNEKIVDLIYNPQPKNWPEYATPMAPMPQVPKDEALKIAAWINSLKK